MTNKYEKIDDIFKFIDQTTKELKKYLNIGYQDALSENVLNILNKKTFVEDGFPTPEQAKNLNQQYEQFDLQSYDKVEIKQALNLAIVKAQQEDKIDVNHLMTPNIIGTLTTLIINEIFADFGSKTLKTIDPAVGTSNLLLSASQDLEQNTLLTLQMYGIDNDDSVLALADALNQATNSDVDLYHQDAVADWIVSDFDLVLTDLPVGYYPIDENTMDFQTKAESGHSYVHHLLMEQSMKNVRPDGIGIFVVPSQIFQTDQAKSLAQWMVTDVYLQAVLTLPQDLFSSTEAAKSIVILQKHGDKAKQAEQVLMGQFPNLSNTKDMNLFKKQLVDWSQNTFSWEE